MEITTVTDEGSAVHKGDTVARIADLGSFRVEARISDVHANQLKFGMPVKVKVSGAAELQGSIAGILPTTQNGGVTLDVSLEDKSNALLRPDLRVDVLIRTQRKNKALRIQKGPALAGEGTTDVFVIRGPVAVKTAVRLGPASSDPFEAVQGLQEGDEVIISDMRGYMHLKEAAIR